MKINGDLYLIKMVRSRRVLWDKENRDRDKRDTAWKEVADLIHADCNWVRSRWCGLRQRFVQELRLVNSDNPRGTGKFKYFKEMFFLLKQVEFRGFDGSQSKLLTGLYDECKKKYGIKDAFVITEKDLEEPPESEDDVIFQEITTNQETISKDQDLDLEDPESQEGSTEIFQVVETEADQCDIYSIPDSNIVASEEPTEASPKVEDVESSLQNNHAGSSERCEDTIFGELVTAMLKRTSHEKKKVVKKEIMNLLLS